MVEMFNKALKKSRRAVMMNGDIADVNNADGAETVNGAVPILVDNAEVDEYVDINDEMPTATYQSVEIKKGTEATSVSGGSGSGSSSSSGSGSGSSGDSTSEAANARPLV
ncbi:uncharacterized protein [Aegilops tauschii subsp. strangulata]|uniref:uncharacterized protein n=1 Tax=Aegilops tauschii subsp. strangulata TaxID=200361 RepID=UPI001ABD18FD|nr:transcription factor GTE7-like [Aegilops tauschii subsp. strangulata]